jgi:S-DNA-T family DNA segregation ATPase FtsK/SpoIIIE
VTIEPIRRENDGAAVIPLRPIADRLADLEVTSAAAVEKLDRSYEVELDEPVPTAAAPVYVDPPPARVIDVRPIIPDHLRGRRAVAASAKRAAARGGRIAAFHAVRAPVVYAPKAAFWSLAGLLKLVRRQMAWWWDLESFSLRQEAANNNDAHTYRTLDKETRAKRSFRGWVLVGELVGLVIAATVLLKMLPAWVVWLLVVGLVLTLARFGRPAGKPIVGRAVVAPRFRKLNADIVLRAYYAAGLGHPDKPDQQVQFGSTMSRDAMNSGSQVVVDLPYGKTFDDVVKSKKQLASGLDVTEYQVFLTRDKTSTRRHLLFVADRDPLAIPAGRTPLLNCKPTDIWKPAPLGLDERGKLVALALMWISVLIGAQPRKGKTFTARHMALYAALDPYVKLFVADGKASPDWRAFALVAERMVFGTAPTARDGDPVEKLIDMLRHIKRHIQRVNEVLSRLPVEVCPEGKLTRELARDLRYPELRVWMLVMEEFQAYYELDDKKQNEEIAGLLSYIMAVGPSAGVILLSSSQKPSGVGAGDIQRVFNRFRDNHAVRFALKCGNRNVSEAILGTEAYGEGIDATALPVGPEYMGVGYLYGASDLTPTVRGYLADQRDAEKILKAARKHREQLGTLSGEAAGDMTIEGEVVDVLTDALAVVLPTEANVSFARLASRLADRFPERYGETTAAVISAQLRNAGARSKNVKDRDYFEGGVGQGVAREQLEELAARRAVSG